MPMRTPPQPSAWNNNMRKVNAVITNITKAMSLGQYPCMKGNKAMTGVIAMRMMVMTFGRFQIVARL